MTNPNEGFTSRWGNPIADDRQWCHVPGYILRNYHACVSTVDVYEDGKLICARGEKVGLSLADCMFVVHVMAFKYDSPDGKAAPSLATIAEYAGIDISNVRRIKARLLNHGLLTVNTIPGKPDEYNFKGLHDQCVRLQEGKTPLEGVEVTTRKITGTGKNARTSTGKNARGVLVKSPAEELEIESEEKKEKEEQEIPAPQAAADSAPELHEVPKPTSSKKKRASPHEPEFNELVQCFKVEKLTKIGSRPYWNVAAQLHEIGFPVERIRGLHIYVKAKQQREGWSGFTVNALGKYAGEYLRDHPVRVVMSETELDPEPLPAVAGGETQHYPDVATMIAEIARQKSGNRK